jgi:membrane protease YdiL (CAAX protease family)
VMKSRLNWKYTVLFATTIVLAVPFINAMAAWNSGISLPGFLADIEFWVRSKEEVANALIELFLSMNTPGDFVFNLVLIAFIPAISEELFFRGMMQPLVVKSIKNIHLAIWTTAFLFSFLHLQFLGFLPRMVLGAVLGYAAHWSGSLIVPMAGHLANNALALTLSWLAQRNLISPTFDTIGAETDEIQWAIVSTISLFVCMWIIWSAYQKLKTPREEGFIS